MKNGICVLGSLNVDLTVTMDRFHQPGETIMGSDFHVYTGGKGGNQTIAAARLLPGAVSMVACVGDDDNGKMYLRVLTENGVNTQGIVEKNNTPTGVALIEVDKTGENRIVVVSGANALLLPEVVETEKALLQNSRVCLAQLETPMESVRRAAQIAHEAGIVFILDPAPAQPVPGDILALCDYVTPNETELAILTGMPTDTLENAQRACEALLKKGARAVINKRGSQGALYVTKEGAQRVPGYKVDAVDTTAAGDTFNAAFAAGLALEMQPIDALRLANAAAAISTTQAGAQSAMPGMEEAMNMVDFGKIHYGL